MSEAERQKAESLWARASLMRVSSLSVEIIKDGLAAARREGIEEAAKVAEEEYGFTSKTGFQTADVRDPERVRTAKRIAAAIRRLNEGHNDE